MLITYLISAGWLKAQWLQYWNTPIEPDNRSPCPPHRRGLPCTVHSKPTPMQHLHCSQSVVPWHGGQMQGAIPSPYILGWRKFVGKSSSKICLKMQMGLKTPIWGKIRDKIEILSTMSEICRCLSEICNVIRKFQNFLAHNDYNITRGMLEINTTTKASVQCTYGSTAKTNKYINT